MSVLGLDVGTTGCKAVAVTADGSICGRAYREYRLHTPLLGWAELDVADVWEAICTVSRQATHELTDPVEAFAVSAAGEVVFPVSQDGVALGPAIVSLDKRASEQFARLVKIAGEPRLRELGGFDPQPYHSIARWIWLSECLQHAYRSARWLSGWMEFVCLRVDVPPTVDRSLAVRSLGFNLRDDRWDDSLLASVGLDSTKLPQVVPSGTLIGHAGGRGCEELGIPAGVAVVAGGLDQLCAAHALGVGFGSPGMLAIGTTAALAASATAWETSPSLPRVPGIAPGTDLVIGGTPAGGALLRWFRDQLGGEARVAAKQAGREAYDVLLEGVGDTRTSVLALPHLGGSRVAFDDPDATGALIGLTFGTRRVEIVRALLDGVAYEIAAMHSRFTENGIRIPSLLAAGGGSRSRAWMQINADATGMTIHSTATGDAAAYGAARLASLAAASGTELPVLEPLEVFKPRPEWGEYHAARRHAFAATFEALRRTRKELGR